jgi:uncharacterized protein
LGHGAGGGVAAPDLVAAAAAARELGVAVALVEQPYRVAGRRSAAPAHHLDTAWEVVMAHLRETHGDVLLVTGGRSSGARVACRTAAATAATGVLCLAFPLQPPPRKSGTQADSRLPELDGVEVPTLVVQGTNDRFGMPPSGPRRTVVELRGDHGLKSDVAGVQDAVRDWLAALLQG